MNSHLYKKRKGGPAALMSGALDMASSTRPLFSVQSPVANVKIKILPHSFQLRGSFKNMDHKNLSEAAPAQLDRILAFFPRADAKGSVLLAVDTGMLAVLASNLPSSSAFDCWLLILLIPVFLIAGSLWHLYKGAFPSLKGGHGSLIYFREIAKRTESKFIDEFTDQSEQAYLKDILSQVWRNSEILKEKFDHISAAFNWMAIAILPWAASLVMVIIRYAARTTAKLP